jgi:hypothetical protein
MAKETPMCEWKDCVVAARFHMEVPRQFSKGLSDKGGLRLPFGHSHQNVCGAHLDEYSARHQPKAIYSLGKCPHCDAD